MFLQVNSSDNPARKQLLESGLRRWPLGAGAFTLMAVSAAATAGYAWLVGPLLRSLDAGLLSQSSPAVVPQPGPSSSLGWAQIAGLLVCLGLARALAETARSRLASRFQLGVVREFRGKILGHVLSLGPATLARWAPGKLASRIQVEVHGVRVLLQVGLAHGIRSILVATALATVALRVDTALAIPGLLVVPLAVVLVFFAARPARRLQKALFAAESTVVADTAEAIDGAQELLAYAAEASVQEKIDRAASISEQHAVAAETWSTAAAPTVELAGAVGVALVVVVAWSTGTPMDLPATGTVLVALILMFRPLHGLAQAIFGWSAGLGSLDRLDELLRMPSDTREPVRLRREPVTSLRVEGLGFAYGDTPILENLGITFRSGELVAITGPSGTGKSTLLAVLSGALPAQGSAWIDEVETSRDTLSAASAWMPQIPMLFHDTILANIALGDRHPDRTRALQAAKDAGAHDFVSARPGGYEGVLRQGGTDLSAGQRQRIAFARALYRAAPVWLLDEPSSALDEAQEQRVLETCRAHAERGGLVIVATHREDFLRRADRVLELQDRTVNEWESRPGHALLH